MIELIRKGFDGLDVAIEAQITKNLFRELFIAKEKAGVNKTPYLLKYGDAQMHVEESGGVGGYKFRCDTGPVGATWFFKVPSKKDTWGIRVSFKSLTLALYGIEGARAQIDEFLSNLGIDVAEGSESIGRVDFCLDFLIPNFVLEPEHFVMHSRTNRSDYSETDIQRNGTSGCVTSVTVGKTPGRQLIVYDKYREIVAKRKPYWWKIWNDARKQNGKSEFNSSDKNAAQIWRVELRAGKKHLKDRWKIRKWSDLEERLGDVFLSALKDIRYVSPTEDQNRSRWSNHPLWDAVVREVSGGLSSMVSGLEPSEVKEVIRQEHSKLLEAQLIGLSATYASIQGLLPENAGEISDMVKQCITQFDEFRPGALEKKVKKARDRYVFYDEETGNNDSEKSQDL